MTLFWGDSLVMFRVLGRSRLGQIVLVVLGVLALAVAAGEATSGTGSGLDSTAYEALPQCTTQSVPTPADCIVLVRGTVQSSRSLAGYPRNSYYTTVSDKLRGTQEIQLVASASQAGQLPANTQVLEKYYLGEVTAVEPESAVEPPSAAGHTMISTVASPVGQKHMAANNSGLVGGGLLMVGGGGIPFLIGLRGGFRRRRQPVAVGAGGCGLLPASRIPADPAGRTGGTAFPGQQTYRAGVAPMTAPSPHPGEPGDAFHITTQRGGGYSPPVQAPAARFGAPSPAPPPGEASQAYAPMAPVPRGPEDAGGPWTDSAAGTTEPPQMWVPMTPPAPAHGTDIAATPPAPPPPSTGAGWGIREQGRRNER